MTARCAESGAIKIERPLSNIQLLLATLAALDNDAV
jgi:hypothetical protein